MEQHIPQEEVRRIIISDMVKKRNTIVPVIGEDTIVYQDKEAGKEIAEVSYFDLSGRRTDTLVPGTMYVKQTRYKDGTKDCRKFVSK